MVKYSFLLIKKATVSQTTIGIRSLFYIFAPASSSAQYLLTKWLAAYGLTTEDVRIQNTDAVPGLQAFFVLEQDITYPDFFKETGYGTATGLKGVNCTHDFYPFWEGASIIPDDLEEPAPVKINGREYDHYQVSQQQRNYFVQQGLR